MIMAGCKHVDDPILGVYAGSHDSYLTFKDLFNPIIEEYHGYQNNASHPKNQDWE